jgi:hypothetical protein
MEFDYFTKPDLYMVSKRSGFRDIRCVYCGSFGSADRAYPSDSAPANTTVKGTWGRHASPGLKGKDFYTKQERDRQLASVGRISEPIDEGAAPNRPRSAKVYKRNEEGKIAEVVRAKPEPKAIVYDEKAISAKPADIIRKFGEQNGGLVVFSDIVNSGKIESRKLQGGIMGAIRQGWLEKTEQKKIYRLV